MTLNLQISFQQEGGNQGEIGVSQIVPQWNTDRSYTTYQGAGENSHGQKMQHQPGNTVMTTAAHIKDQIFKNSQVFTAKRSSLQN